MEGTDSKFHDKAKNAEVLLDLNSEDYGILEDGSQGNYTLQSNENFKGQNLKQEVKQAKRIKVMDWKDNVDTSGIQSLKFIEEKSKENPSKKSAKSMKSIPKSDYYFDNTSIFDRLGKGHTMEC